MPRWTRNVLLVLVAAALALLVASAQVAPPLYDESLADDLLAQATVLPVDAALTFARTDGPDGPRTWLVVSAGAEGVRAVDLGVALGQPVADPLGALQVAGRAALRDIARAGPFATLPWDALGVPFATGERHIGVGTNYVAHAEETGIDDGPFLFPKLSAPSAWNAAVPARTRLDYEVELCVVPLARWTAAAPSPLGFVLCNDFTDRWVLVREIDLDGPMGVSGFADGKGGAGMLAVGPWLVVPEDAAAFVAGVTLELWRDGRLRQRAPAQWMIWPVDEVLRQAEAGCAVAYATVAGAVPLTACGGIAAGTLVATGTPAGVLFHPLNLWRPDLYLQPGEVVTARGDGLGVLRNGVE